MGNKALLVLAAILALVVGVMSSGKLSFNNGTSNKEIELVAGTFLQPAKTLNEFTLEDHNGNAFTNESFKGYWTILFFGFLNCPDICPSTLQQLKNIKSDLKGKGAWENKQVVFVSVDPDRDKQENLASYIAHFDKEFIGVRGDLESVTSFTKNLSMPFIHEAKNEYGAYNVAHSASLLLVNPKGQLSAIFSAPHDHAKIVYDLAGAPFTQ